MALDEGRVQGLGLWRLGTVRSWQRVDWPVHSWLDTVDRSAVGELPVGIGSAFIMVDKVRVVLLAAGVAWWWVQSCWATQILGARHEEHMVVWVQLDGHLLEVGLRRVRVCHAARVLGTGDPVAHGGGNSSVAL